MALCTATACTATPKPRPPRVQEQITPVLAGLVGGTPQAVEQTDGTWQLVYELELINVSDQTMTIESVVVRAPGSSEPATTIAGAQIGQVLRVSGAPGTTSLGPNAAGLFFVNLTFPSRAAVPARLEHELTVTTDHPTTLLAARTVAPVAAVDVDPTPPRVLGPPLRGGRWIAEASCCDSYHRHAVLPINGQWWVAQRFAIDWLMVRSDGRLYAGDPARNESYPQFGADLLAVSDATVVEVVDGLPEEVPGALPSGMTIDRADGNHVILDLGDGLYAAYAHLQPGSVRVRVGERVERGQVLGWLGNSGNSELPHLHFHVMDRPAPLAADGRPYVIDSFELVGRAVSADDLETEARQPKPIVIDAVPGASRRLRQLPSNLDVVVFE